MEAVINSIANVQKCVRRYGNDVVAITILTFCLKQLGEEGPILLSISDAFVDREEEIEPLRIGYEGEEVTIADIIRFLAELCEALKDADRDHFAGIHKDNNFSEDMKLYVFNLD
ncbi:MAG: hypothetical protein ACMG6E_06910 [Candidatus Roizmanbacteria bacterium]